MENAINNAKRLLNKMYVYTLVMGQMLYFMNRRIKDFDNSDRKIDTHTTEMIM